MWCMQEMAHCSSVSIEMMHSVLKKLFEENIAREAIWLPWKQCATHRNIVVHILTKFHIHVHYTEKVTGVKK